VLLKYFCLAVFFSVVSMCNIVALDKLYKWAMDLLFVYQLGHMLEKVEN